MATPPARPARRRPRRGSLERPVNGRMYRGTWLLVGLPLLVVAFTVTRPAALPPPPLPATFDATTARGLATELARLHPDRSPGSRGARDAARWVSARLRAYGFQPSVDAWVADVPGRGRVRLQNLVAVVPGRSPETIVVMAHRDDVGTGPGANDNASGTAVLIELARAYAPLESAPGASLAGVRPAHTLVFLSTDGGAFGAVGAERFAAGRVPTRRLAAVVNLDGVGGRAGPRVEFGGYAPRSPAPTLVQTAAARLLEEVGERPGHVAPLAQLIDLAFPFSLYEQAPFVTRGIPAVTLTTEAERQAPAFGDSADRLSGRRLEQVGRAAQQLLGSLDQGLTFAPGAGGAYVYLGPRLVRGWAIQLVLVASLLPFLAVAVDLFARCRRRRIPLGPALRSYAGRAGFWLAVVAVFVVLDALGAWPGGPARPLPLHASAAGDWPLLGLGVLAASAAFLWLAARERLLPRRAVSTEEEVAGYAAALLVLAVVALVVVALNPFALLLVLPALHAWVWLPQLRDRRFGVRVGVLAVGAAGPLLLLWSLAARFELGLDAPWYLLALAAVGYVDAGAVLAAAAWLAAAGQLAALVAHRYAPYPKPSERGLGPVRRLIRQTVVRARARRRTPDEDRAAAEA